MIKSYEDLNQAKETGKALLDIKRNCTDGKRTVVFCGGTGCISCKSLEIKDKFEKAIEAKGVADKINVAVVGCFGMCSQGPFIRIYPEDTTYRLVTLDDVDEIVEKDIIGGEVVDRLLYVEPTSGEKVAKLDEYKFFAKQRKVALYNVGIIDPENIQEALGGGAFQGLARSLTMDRQAVIDEVLASGIRGRGGAGFPTGRKWQFAMGGDGAKYVICNGDEGDPGAFMDEAILEGNPLAVIEGMAIAGYAIGAQNGYFYVRAEYPVAVKRLRIALAQAEEIGLLGDNIMGTDFCFRAQIRLGAGAFVCGEETALIHSIEGERGNPRPRPPFPAVKGLWGRPSVVNNVETLASIPYILREGAAEFAAVGTEGSKGTKVFALGGKVNNVGLVEVPMGTTLRELIYDIGGGIPGGKKFKAIQTGGPSGGCLTEKDLDVEIDYDTLKARGSMMGSGGAIVMDEDNCMVNIAQFYMGFICDESCGKCSPCRIGTKRMLEILTRITEGKAEMKDLDELEEISKTIQANSLCALGQTAANPVLSTMTQFRDEYIAHVVEKRCPAKVCKNLMSYVIDKDKCIGCGKCAKNCPVSCITQTDYTAPGHKLASYEINAKACAKCGVCMDNCKVGAISKQ